MLDTFTLSVTVFMGFFAMMNPIANTAVFIGLTSNTSDQQRRKTALKALFTTFIIATLFCLLGKAIFNLFGITLPALRLSGGILVFLVGYQMLQGNASSMHSHENANTDADIAISPMAIPILAGPGTIATAMNYSATGDITHIIITVAAFAALCLITLICFLMGEKLINLVGKNGINITTRLMGLILTVIAMQMFIQGVHDAYKLFYRA